MKEGIQEEPGGRTKESPRGAAARIVARWLGTGAFPDRLLDATSVERGLVDELVYGVVRWRRALDFLMGRLARRRADRNTTAFAWVGLYQLLFADGVPDHAAVFETVEAARGVLRADARGFVNAVLRRAQREREALRGALAAQPSAVRLSHPDALWRRWEGRYGAADAVRLCEWNNARAETFVRVAQTWSGAGRFVELCAERGIEAADAGHADCYRIGRGVRVPDLPGFAEGAFTVQDPATLTAPALLDAQPGERVLDLCAAPGGKTVILAESVGENGIVAAVDVHEDRLERLRETLARCAPNRVKAARADARDFDATVAALEGAALPIEYDAVLVDAPCTNSGVIRRRPDARWRFSEERLARLLPTQRALLETAARLAAAGGRIVYGTCSLEPEENERVVDAFLRDHPDFAPCETRALFPPDSQTDGAYAALLRRC